MLPVAKAQSTGKKQVQFEEEENKVPGEDDDIDWYGQEEQDEEVIPVKACKTFLFGAVDKD